MASAEAYLAGSAARIDIARRNDACYRHRTDEILLPLREQFDAPTAFYQTAPHELAPRDRARDAPRSEARIPDGDERSIRGRSGGTASRGPPIRRGQDGENADRHDRIDAYATLKTLLDDDAATTDEIRDAATRAVNRFEASIEAHGHWRPYGRRGSSNPYTPAAADSLGQRGVERRPEYRGWLGRRVDGTIAQIAIRDARRADASARPSAGRYCLDSTSARSTTRRTRGRSRVMPIYRWETDEK